VKWLLRKITNGLTSVKDFLIPFGAFGLFAIALLDSALIPLPGGPDAVMLLLSAQNPARMPLYALAATAGSVLGCVILYYISRRAGRRALEKFPPQKQARVKELVDRYDVLSVLVASVLPPPFPFKLFVITAGVFRLSLVRFAAAAPSASSSKATSPSATASRPKRCSRGTTPRSASAWPCSSSSFSSCAVC
jgi:membrane protein YqaA with SNARE-associated domain